MTIPVGMDVGAGTGAGATGPGVTGPGITGTGVTGAGVATGASAGTGVGVSTWAGAAIAALEGVGGGAAQGETAAFAPGNGTGAKWPGAAKGNEQPAAGNESFKASWQSMQRAWGVVARTSGGAADPVAGDGGEIGAVTGSNERLNVESAQATFARSGAGAVQSALTTNRSNGPAVGSAAPISKPARAIRLQSLRNAASNVANKMANGEASAQSAATIRAATSSGSSTAVSAGANVKSEKRASGGEDAGAHLQPIPAANGLEASPVDGAGLAVSVAAVQPQITPASLADSHVSRPAKQIDEPLGGASEMKPEAATAAIRAKGSPSTTAAPDVTNLSASARAAKQMDEPLSSASETEPEAAIAAIRAKGSPSTTAAPDATNLSASARAAIPAPASAAQSTLRDEETCGGAAVPVGEQEESAAQPQAALTASAIAAAGTSRAGSASRQRVQGASSSVEEHKAPTGAFETRREANSVSGVSVNPAVATASADKVSAESGALPTQQSMARSAHEAVAVGVSAATGQAVGTNVVVGQTSAPETSAWVRDPGNAHGTAGVWAAHGDSAATQAAAPQETFAALDAGTSVGTPNWIHAGGRQAEAGFQDPALGWVGVRADLSGGTVHAALVPGSTEAAQALSGHLAGLNAYLAEQQTPVATLTMAAPGTSGMETGVDQSMQQSAGQHGEQNPAAAPQSGAQPGMGASSSATAVSATTTNAGFDAIAYVGGSRGTHISVMA